MTDKVAYYQTLSNLNKISNNRNKCGGTATGGCFKGNKESKLDAAQAKLINAQTKQLEAATVMSVLTGGASIFATLAPFMSKLGEKNNNNNPDGAGENTPPNNNNTLDTMNNASSSYDPEVIQQGINAGTEESGRLDSEISQNKQSADASLSEANNAKQEATSTAGAIKTLEGSTIPNAQKAFTARKSDLAKNKTQQLQALDKKSPTYAADKAQIEAQYTQNLETVTTEERTEMGKLKSELSQKKEELRTLNGLAEEKTREAEGFQSKVDSATTTKSQVDNKLQSLKSRQSAIARASSQK